MLNFVKNRVFRYEVMILTEGRWVIRNVMEEEPSALNRARALVHTERLAEAIRVMRVRVAPNGFTTTKEILHLDRLEAFRAQEFQPGTVDDVNVCQGMEDAFCLEARRAVGKLLKPYLGANGLTAIEFLHLAHYQRDLDRKGQLLNAAYHNIAKIQADKTGVEHNERLATVNEIARRIHQASQDFAAEYRHLPKFDGRSFSEVAVEIRERAPLELERFYVTAAVCAETSQRRGAPEKLHYLVQLLGSSDAAGLRILDQIFADLMLMPGFLRDLLGPQLSLYEHLNRCLEIIGGRHEGDGTPKFQPLVIVSHLMRTGLTPETMETFELYFARALGSDAPLDKRESNPEAEQRRLNAFVRSLEQISPGLMSRTEVSDGIARRRKKLRSAILRQAGMEELADQAYQ